MAALQQTGTSRSADATHRRQRDDEVADEGVFHLARSPGPSLRERRQPPLKLTRQVVHRHETLGPNQLTPRTRIVDLSLDHRPSVRPAAVVVTECSELPSGKAQTSICCARSARPYAIESSFSPFADKGAPPRPPRFPERSRINPDRRWAQLSLGRVRHEASERSPQERLAVQHHPERGRDP